MLAKIKKLNFDTFNNISTDDLIAGDIYIVKYDDNTFNEYIIDDNKNKILITSRNAGEIYLDISKYTNDPLNNTLEKAINKIHNEIFCWSGDREGKAKFNKINNYKYKCLDNKHKNTLYFVTPCIPFTIDLNKIDAIVLSHGDYDHGNGLKYLNISRFKCIFHLIIQLNLILYIKKEPIKWILFN